MPTLDLDIFEEDDEALWRATIPRLPVAHPNRVAMPYVPPSVPELTKEGYVGLDTSCVVRR